MENAMLSIRILTAAAVLAMALGGASAQTTATTVPGKPIPLLQVLVHPAKVKTHVKKPIKTARKSATRRRKAVATADATPAPTRIETPAPVQTATDAPANIWPAVNAPKFAAAEAASAAPGVVAAAPANPAANEIVVGDQTVQVASPDDINDIDRAANKDAKAHAALKSDFARAAPAAQAMVAASAQAGTSAVGTASWIAKVLAALGGAIAAGSAAWFLIGSTPQRTYG
jgi:hypothetical protein